MVNHNDYLAIFNSIHRVMKAEKILKELRLPILLIPAPKALTADCGLAIRYSTADREAVESAMKDAGVEPEMIYVKQSDRYVLVDATAVKEKG